MNNNVKEFKEIQKEIGFRADTYYRRAIGIKTLWDIINKTNTGDRILSHDAYDVIDYYKDIFMEYKYFITYTSSIGDFRLNFKLDENETENMCNALQCIYAQNLDIIENIILEELSLNYDNITIRRNGADHVSINTDNNEIINFIMSMPCLMFIHIRKDNKIILKRRILKDNGNTNKKECTDVDELMVRDKAKEEDESPARLNQDDFEYAGIILDNITTCLIKDMNKFDFFVNIKSSSVKRIISHFKRLNVDIFKVDDYVDSLDMVSCRARVDFSSDEKRTPFETALILSRILDKLRNPIIGDGMIKVIGYYLEEDSNDLESVTKIQANILTKLGFDYFDHYNIKKRVWYVDELSREKMLKICEKEFSKYA